MPQVFVFPWVQSVAYGHIMPDGKKKEKVKVIWSPFAMLFMNNYSRQSVSTIGPKTFWFIIFVYCKIYLLLERELSPVLNSSKSSYLSVTTVPQQQGEHYLGNFGNLEKRVHFLKVLVKDIWKTGFRSSLSQKLKICRPF